MIGSPSRGLPLKCSSAGTFARRYTMNAASAVPAPLVALVGNPNCGKTALFNVLTGNRQKVANYAGVTVERKEGFLRTPSGKRVRILDLPGAYSLDPLTPDERVTADVLFGRRAGEASPDFVVCVTDATNLRQNLRLVLCLKRLGLPMVIALNMTDLARRRGLAIDAGRLREELGVPVVETVGVKASGAVALVSVLDQVAAPAEKRRIVELTLRAGASVRAIAREHGAHPVDGGEARPVGAGTEHEQLGPLVDDRRRHHVPVGVLVREAVTEKRQQLADLGGKLGAGVGVDAPAQGVGRERIGAGGPAQREIDTARVHGQQGSERLSDLQRRVVGKHDATRSDADGARDRGDLTNHDLGGRAGEAPCVVMFGEPVATKAERVRVSREVERVSERISRRGSGRDGRQVEGRQGQTHGERA